MSVTCKECPWHCQKGTKKTINTDGFSTDESNPRIEVEIQEVKKTSFKPDPEGLIVYAIALETMEERGFQPLEIQEKCPKGGVLVSAKLTKVS